MSFTEQRRYEQFLRLTLDNALAEIAARFRVRGVRSLLLKGPAFAQWLYDDPRVRPYHDLDLLVAPDGFDPAAHELAGLGFEPFLARPNERVHHHGIWLRPGPMTVQVELHNSLRLLSMSLRHSLVWDRLSHNARTIVVAGTEVDVPSEAVSALIAALHAAQHGGEEIPLRDLRQALERTGMDTWGAAASLARELDAELAFAAGLRLDSAGREVASRLELPDGVPPSLRLLDVEAAMDIERLVRTRGAGARLKLLASELVPSREFMIAYSPLARRGGLGLVCAYLWRPVRLAWLFPRALQAWARARSVRPAP